MEIDLRKKDILNEKNPFMVELKGKMYLQPRANAIIAKGEHIVDKITGEILEDNVLIGRRKEVDKSQFAKIYASEIAILFDLSRTAINVLLYIMRVMDFENKAYINTGDPKKIGYKTSLSVRNALKELISKHILAPAMAPGWYWVNPTIICKGERFAKYTEYVTKEYAEKEEARRKLKEDKKEIYKSQNINRRAGYIAAGAYEVTEKEDYAEAAKPIDSNNKPTPRTEIPSRWAEHRLISEEEMGQVVSPQEQQD